MMTLHNVREFYAAGLGFSIVDADADFDEKGELSGYSEVCDHLYAPRENSRESEGLIDTLELTDDGVSCVERAGYSDDGSWEEASFMNGRWAHVRDAHLDEALAEARLVLATVGESREYGEMEMMGRWRKERYTRLLKWVERSTNKAKLRSARREIWRRYIQTVKSCAKSGRWWALYLTKEQIQDLSARIDKRSR
jgi:hypothetical protein